MKENLFLWVKNVAYYMILVMTVMHVIPNEKYLKYIRLFTGMILILLLSSPLLQILAVRTEELSLINIEEYQKKLDEINEETKDLYDINAASYVEEEDSKNVDVESIRINKIELGE